MEYANEWKIVRPKRGRSGKRGGGPVTRLRTPESRRKLRDDSCPTTKDI
jgi:hypothetical protein